MQQVHGSAVAVVSESGLYPSIDALVTRVPRLALAVRIADCAPLILYAPAQNVLAAVHAGWRSIASGIVPAVIGCLHGACGVEANDLFAYIGPSARGCCYDIGSDIAELFPEEALRRRPDGGLRLDLAAALLRLLGDAGVPPGNMEADPLCSICHPALFHSHRRDGAASGRMLAVCALRDEL